MLTTNLTRPLIGLVLTAGLLAAAGPAAASQSEPSRPQASGYTTDFDVVEHLVRERAPGPLRATEELFGNYNFLLE